MDALTAKPTDLSLSPGPTWERELAPACCPVYMVMFLQAHT